MDRNQLLRSERASALMLTVTLLIVLMAAIVIGAAVIGSVQQEQVGLRHRARLESSESLVVTTAAMEAIGALEKVTADATTGGYVDVLGSDFAGELQLRTRARLAASDIASNFPRIPIDVSTVEVTRPPMFVHDPSSGASPFGNASVVSLTAKPYVLRSPPLGLSSPYRYLDYVPPRHPLANLLVRRFPMSVSYVYSRDGVRRKVTRQLSMYQVPVAQFARFSSGQMNLAAQSNVTMAAGGSAFAFGQIAGAGGNSFNRLWASQVDTFATVANSGTEAERQFNLGSAATAKSRIGARLTGEAWSLSAPHFFTSRSVGEKVPGSARPVPTTGEPSYKAYEAQTFVEVLFHPDTVTSANLDRGPVTINVYNRQGNLLSSAAGVMRGTAATDTPPFEETILDYAGNFMNTRRSRVSTSTTLLPGVSKAVAAMDLLAPVRGDYTFRALGSGSVRLEVNGSVVLDSSTSNPSATVALAPGRHRVTITRGAMWMGEMTFFVTPPGCPEAYLSQWSVHPDTDQNEEGSFATSFIGSGNIGWHIVPSETRGNNTGIPALALVLKMDQPWSLDSSTDPVVYVEGVRVGQSRYFAANGFTWSPVLVELSGATLSPDIVSRNSLTVLSANPIVIGDQLSAPGYHGLYLVTRGTEGPDTNSVYMDFDQAFTKSVAVTGVVGGNTASLRSYFDRASPTSAQFTARAATRSESNPFFKTLVLVDDFLVAEEVVP